MYFNNKGLIIDLDQTIVDSSMLDCYKNNNLWEKAILNIVECKLYPGIKELLHNLHLNNVKICIFTGSRREYAETFIKIFDLKVDSIVAYDDIKVEFVKPNKIHAETSLVSLMCTKKNTIVVGDSSKDIYSGKSAGLKTVGVTWGREDSSKLINSRPDFLAHDVSTLRKILKLFYNLN